MFRPNPKEDTEQIKPKTEAKEIKETKDSNIQTSGPSITITVIEPPKSEQTKTDSVSVSESGRGRSLEKKEPAARSASADFALQKAQSVIQLKPRNRLRRLSWGLISTPTSFSPTVSESTSEENSPLPSPRQERKHFSDGFFAPITNRAYNAATLYNLLIDSEMTSTQIITSYPDINPDDMLLDDVDKLDDERVYHLGFTRKICTGTGITHGSLAFRDVETGKFLIVGRQNSQFLKVDPSSQPFSATFNWTTFAWWTIKNVVDYHSYWNFTTTKMDNEKKYDFFPGTPFNAEMTEVALTGAEIKAMIKAVDENICLSQCYDAIHSNCYSSVFFGLTTAFKMIAARECKDDEVSIIKQNKDLKRIFTLIGLAMQDNHKAGFGSINNTVVNESIQDTIDILEKRDLLQVIDEMVEKKDEKKTSKSSCGFGSENQ
ncbi:hypothetical protein AQUSIP_06690 [Aquicella siphonis]|uniref:Uncharacterized protein n=1 Tax=Aquicella siphonis TaxID=254247 RepID=A0A5E4PEG9_9COXI|nr:hypothetical protein [Aquicella siphonis]VVC75379.1 hypothetical protein AQUSIP_06690 [Aquicella siphonis]